MILRTETVEQTIDAQRRVTLEKEVVMTPGAHPLGMVRKRLPPPARTRGTVLLVHGFGQNRYIWHLSRRSFSTYLASEGWDVFNVELRGHGRSRRFGSGAPELLAEYIREDVPACAREALRLSGDERLFLVGHSMGGIIGYGAGATALRDVARGIVTIGSPYRFGMGSRRLTTLMALLRTVRATGVFDGNPKLPLRLLGRHMQRRRALWDSKLLPLPLRPWSPGSVENEVLDEYLSRAFDMTSLSIMFDILRTREGILRTRVGKSNFAQAFEHLDVPLLIVSGTRDSLAPPSSVRPAYERSRAADKTYREFALGHIDLIVGREAPLTVWPLIRSWLLRR